MYLSRFVLFCLFFLAAGIACGVCMHGLFVLHEAEGLGWEQLLSFMQHFLCYLRSWKCVLMRTQFRLARSRAHALQTGCTLWTGDTTRTVLLSVFLSVGFQSKKRPNRPRRVARIGTIFIGHTYSALESRAQGTSRIKVRRVEHCAYAASTYWGLG